MTKYTYEKLTETIERNGFYFEYHQDHCRPKTQRGNYALLEQSTPLGEDWCIEIDYSNIGDLIDRLIKYADDYDVDEEAAVYIECRGKNGVPESITDLLEDSRWKKDVLLNLSNELQGKKSKSDCIYLDDITGTIGEWLEGDTQDIPAEAIKHLQMAYSICADNL